MRCLIFSLALRPALSSAGCVVSANIILKIAHGWQNILRETVYQTRETVFHRDIQTPRRVET